ncbi:MAG TPA: tetratricopeptide repeat protein [Anaerolineales bacterium]|nr:tetratricopeptide repeat protein [Anaerolineales bacterium]
MTGRIQKTVFISYRRTNFWTALAVFQNLHTNGYDVFFDYKSIPSGAFEQVITENVKSRAHFIVILSPSALERCHEPGDWLRREIETAIDNQRNIIPLLMEGFDFGSRATAKALTGKLSDLKKYNALSIPAEYFEEAMMKLRSERFLNRPLESVLHPVSDITKQITEEQKSAANQAARVETEQLTAQEWFERGYVSAERENFDEAIRCYTRAILLAPNRTEAYYNRGLIFGRNTGESASAITDFDVVIRLKPLDADAYYSRGLSYYIMGDKFSALKDFRKASELSPQDGKIRVSLVGVLKAVGQTDEAKLQESIAHDLIQKENEYNQACFESIRGNTDKALNLLQLLIFEK